MHVEIQINPQGLAPLLQLVANYNIRESAKVPTSFVRWWGIEKATLANAN